MNVLGLGGSNHDFSSCIVKDGKVIWMVEDERITRKKHGIGLGIELAKGLSWKSCLDIANMCLEDIDLVVANDILNKALYHRIGKDVLLINHHLAHAASSYYPSEFENSAILVVDSVGSKDFVDGVYKYESVSFFYGDNKKIELLDKQYGKNIEGTDNIENSLGVLYSIITLVIGFKEHEEGKTMGLAPYGTDRYYEKVKNHFRHVGNGKIEMTEEDISKLLSYKNFIDSIQDEDEKFKVKADFAWAVQKILEDTIVYFGEHLLKLTGASNLCIAGGVGLNSVANYKIYKTGIFKNIFVQPATGDNGTSIGSALYGYYNK